MGDETVNSDVPPVAPAGPAPAPAVNTDVNYKYMGKEKLSSVVGKMVGREFMPTKKSGYAIGGIFLLMVLIGVAQFPFGSIMSGDVDFDISIGLPWPFLVFSLMHPENLPIKFWNLIIDLVIYAFIAYAIDVSINLFLKSTSILPSREAAAKKPKMYAVKQPPKKDLADRLAEKAAAKVGS